MNAAIAALTLALVDVARNPRSPWHYVVVPISLLVANVLVVAAYLVRLRK